MSCAVDKEINQIFAVVSHHLYKAVGNAAGGRE